MHQALGRHPAQRVASDIEPAGIVADDAGAAPQAVGGDAAPERALGGDPRRSEAALHAMDAAPLEPLRQGVRRHFGGFAKGVAQGLALRHDHGSQHMADAFQKELRFLGITSSPAFVRAPEGNGCAERVIRTLKENLLRVRSFDTVEELRRALIEFRETTNATWLIERHGFRSPDAIRRQHLANAALAA